SFARRFHVPNKNTPSIAPLEMEAIESPASRTGPHGSNPNEPSTTPQTSVIQRERRSDLAALSLPSPLPAPPRSIMLEDASEFNEPLAFDIATAKIDASTIPASPRGISRTINSGKIRSGSPAGTENIGCWAQT